MSYLDLYSFWKQDDSMQWLIRRMYDDRIIMICDSLDRATEALSTMKVMSYIDTRIVG